MCNCQVCKDIRHLRECEVSSEFIDRYLDEGLDANYNQAILDGSLPSSVEILEKALANAKLIKGDSK